jgi:hypothetical protein
MVDTVLLPSACGSIHFPAKPGSASWPATGWVEEDGTGATVTSGNGDAGNITGGNVADERVADGSGDGDAVGGGGVAMGVMVALGMVK